MSDNIPCVHLAVQDAALRPFLETALVDQDLVDVMADDGTTTGLAQEVYERLLALEKQHPARVAVRRSFGTYHSIQRSGIVSCLRVLAVQIAASRREPAIA